MAGHWLAYLSTEATVAPVAALWNDVVVPAPGVCPGFGTGEACVVCGLCCEGRGREGRGRRGRGEEGWGGMGGFEHPLNVISFGEVCKRTFEINCLRSPLNFRVGKKS